MKCIDCAVEKTFVKVARTSLLFSLWVLLTSTLVAQAQTYPSKPIKLVVPFAPGGAADIIGRLVADRLQQDLAQPVVIINKDGAGTIIGVDFVAKSAPDGYTLLMGNDAMAINAATARKLPYDLSTDLTPISLVYRGPQFVLVNKASAINSLADLVKLSKDNHFLKYGTSGTGSSTHLNTAALCEVLKIDPQHIPYRGIAPAISDLLGGHVDFVVAGSASASPLIISGSAKVIAILNKTRSAQFPKIASSYEQGFEVEAAGWYGLMAPSGLSATITSKLISTMAQAAQNSAFKDKLLVLSGEPQTLSGHEFGDYIQSEVQKFSKLIKSKNILIQP